jgi:Phage stabilisation protein
MADFGFVGASYTAPSIYQDDQECINFRPEIDPAKGQGARGVVALYPTPGLTNVVTLQNAQSVRGMRTVSGGNYCVAVCGPYVYVLNSTFTPTIIGQLNSSTGQVGITDNGQNVYIVDGSYRYTWRISQPNSAVFFGTISGTTLTVTRVISGTIAANQSLFGIGVLGETVIVSGSGTTWTLNQANTISTAIKMNSAAVAGVITASISGSTLTVSAVASGTIYPGQTIQGAGVTANTVVTALGSGTVLSQSIATGGTGYAVNDTVTVLGGVYGSSPATYTVTAVTSGAVTALTQTFSGAYTSTPTNNVSTSTNGGGTGLTLTLTFGTGTGTTGNYVVSGSQTVSSETMYLLNFSVLPSSDGAFQGASVVDIVDNYFVYNRPNTQQYAASNLLSPITYGLSYASKFTGPDNLVSLICDHGQVYLLGEQTTEVWADQGTFPFAFQRIPGSSSQHGLAAQFSIARLGNSFAYVAKNNRGQAEIVIMNGYFPQRISTHAVENTLVNQNISDAIAYTYQLEGHECYVVTFPSLDITWVYDITTQLWHKWLWTDIQNNYHRHRSNCSAFFQNVVLVGDYENGQIYKLDPNNYTDDGNTIRRLRRCPHLTTDFQRQYFDELQIQFQPGVGLQGITDPPLNTETTGANPQAMLRWSSDGGSTWSNEHWSDIGKVGKYRNRIIWRRLGYARDRIFEVVVTDPIFACIVSANLKASAGEN